jgi:acyl-CoA thioesterase FadM
VDCSLLLPRVLHVDDQVTAEAVSVGGGRFTVRLFTGSDHVVICRAKVSVALVRERDAQAHEPLSELDFPIVDALTPIDLESSSHLELPTGSDPLAALVQRSPGTFGWSWRVPYFYCQFSDRVAHSGYVRALEETVDRFLDARGISVGRMLTERGWIPVVSRSRVTLLNDAHMEETMLTTFRVHDIWRHLTYDGQMDCYVVRDGRLVPVATARIQHGYAVSRGPAAGRLADLDETVLAALTAGHEVSPDNDSMLATVAGRSTP